MDEYIDVKIDIFEHTGQRARVRRSLTTGGLIDEILKEFDDVSRASIDRYALYLKGTERPLRKSFTITELDLQPQDELVFEYFHQNIRENLLPQQVAYLNEPITGKTFEIQWTPAVIGRPTAEAEHNLMLAVNTQDIPSGMTISRKHAQITFEDDRYFIEPLTEINPVLVNDEVVPFNSRKEIKNNDRLIFGNQKVTMVFKTHQPSGTTSARDSRPQQIPPVVRQPIPPKPDAKPVSTPPASPQQPVRIDNVEKVVIPPVEKAMVSCFVIERATVQEQIGQRIEMASFPFILGRTLPLLSTESGVSRRHAEVNYDINTNIFTVTDLMSTNGVTVEGLEIMGSTPYEIKSGTHIGLGPDVLLKLEG